MKSPSKMTDPLLRRITAAVRALELAVKAADAKPPTLANLRIGLRLRRLQLSAIKVRNIVSPPPRISLELFAGWRKGWKRPTTAEHEQWAADAARRRCGSATVAGSGTPTAAAKPA